MLLMLFEKKNNQAQTRRGTCVNKAPEDQKEKKEGWERNEKLLLVCTIFITL